MGCATLGSNVPEAEALVLAAELAVSQAKELGRDRVCRFDNVFWGEAGEDPYRLHRFLKDGSLATIQALAAAVDAKDAYTQGHSSRVSQLAADLAAFMGLSDSEVEDVRIAGTLHDVGKIGVPDAILAKQGRLTDVERDIMETHPVLGEVIVRKAPQLGAMLAGVRSHHERWDGRGYPDRLQGEQIPLMARIIAIADTYDAITSVRPYREPLSEQEALEEIARHSGRQFDPVLVQHFLVMMTSRVGPSSRSQRGADPQPVTA
jgi:HD-GYP domain-containing protein (c-di-GMP phosphodiesterase class II)